MEITVLLAEQPHLTNKGLSRLLQKEVGIKIIGTANNRQEVVKLLKNGLTPDVIITDMNLPEADGKSLARELLILTPGLKVMMMAKNNNESELIEAFHLGAKGYIVKNVSNEELVFGIRRVADGDSFISNTIALNLLERYKAESHVRNSGHSNLTKREVEVLKLVADGFTNKEIADKLFTSIRTVEGHRRNLIEKTATINTASLIKYAFKCGIVN